MSTSNSQTTDPLRQKSLNPLVIVIITKLLQVGYITK